MKSWAACLKWAAAEGGGAYNWHKAALQSSLAPEVAGYSERREAANTSLIQRH